MRDLVYALKTFAVFWLATALLGPILLNAGLAMNVFPGAYMRAHPFLYPALALCLPMLGIGFLFARYARLSAVLYRRYLPVLVLPALAMLAWAWALYVSGGDYYRDQHTPHWDLVGLLTLPQQTLMFLFSINRWQEFLALVTHLGLLPADFSNGPSEDAYYFYQNYFTEWSGIGAGLFFQLAWALGFTAGDLRQKRLAPEARSLKGWLPVLLLALGAGGVLLWQVYEREHNLLSSRNSWEQEDASIVSGDLATWEYDPRMEKNRLARPDSPPSLIIRNAHPRLDGATAFYPLYAAVFNAVYQPPAAAPDESRSDARSRLWKFTDEHLARTTTRKGYSRLIDGKSDIFFALEPSQEQLREAREKGVVLRLIPIGREAFVFMAHAQNPVSSLSEKQIRDIYARRVRNWKELGGPDAPILAFQRPVNSGSQTIMLHAVMRGESMTQPLREEMLHEMGEIVTQVASYRNQKTSIGYSFRWYATEMKKVPDLKLLAVNGIAPTVENIASGAYPYTVPFYAVVREGALPPATRELLDWLTGPEGRALIAKAGYVPFEQPQKNY